MDGLIVVLLAFVLFFHKATSYSLLGWSKPDRHDINQSDTDDSSCPVSNVFYPRYCTGDECTLSVSWKGHLEWVEFNLTGKTQGDAVWVGIGFSKDGKMAGSDVVACGYQQHQVQLYNAWISAVGRSCYIQSDKSTLQFHSANYTSGIFSCHKSKFNASLDGKDKPLTQNWHILLAWGQLDLSSNSVKLNQHAEKFSTGCACNVTDCSQMCSCANQLKTLLLKLHGSIMIIVFVFLLPLASLIARHYRSAFPENWFKSHMSLMSMGILGMLLGLGFILGHTGGNFSVGYHEIFGIVTIGLGVCQGTIGVFRPHSGKSLQRKLFEFFHRTNAALILLLGTVSLFLGAWYLHHRHKVALIWMESLLGASVLISLAMFAFLEIKNKIKSCQIIEPLVKYRKLNGQHSINGTDSEEEEEEEVYVKEETSKLNSISLYFKEKVIFLLFILQSFTLTGLLSAFAFYEIPKL